MQDEEVVDRCLQVKESLLVCCCFFASCLTVLVRLAGLIVKGDVELSKGYLFLLLASGSKKANIHTVEVASQFKAFCRDKRNLYADAHPPGGLRAAFKSPAAREGSTLAFLTEE